MPGGRALKEVGDYKMRLYCKIERRKDIFGVFKPAVHLISRHGSISRTSTKMDGRNGQR